MTIRVANARFASRVRCRLPAQPDCRIAEQIAAPNGGGGDSRVSARFG
jgi:hypothetical protein